MATYNVTYSGGNTINISPGQTDTSTSLTLIGQGVTNYGEFIAQNFISLLENFASGTPSNPIEGQLWYDAGVDKLKVYDGNVWLSFLIESPGNAAGVSSPGTLTPGPEGALKWFPALDQLYASDGSDWILVGPSAPLNSSTGTVAYQLGGGAWLNIEVANGQVVGVWADSSIGVGSLPTGSTTIQVNADTVSIDFQTVFPEGLNPGLNIPNTSWIQSTVGSQDASNRIEVDNTSGTLFGNWTLDSGTTLEATYADVAERYSSDNVYSAGTVVILGGANEITTTNKEMDIEVFGVISENPAFAMNKNAGDNNTHPYVALSGRVPVQVKGPVRKGQRLVTSTEPGIAIAVDLEYELSQGNYKAYAASFARALEDKSGNDVGTVEATIGAK